MGKHSSERLAPHVQERPFGLVCPQAVGDRDQTPLFLFGTAQSTRLQWREPFGAAAIGQLPMEIPLFQQDATLKFERAVLYPYPDKKRIWTRLWLTAVPDSRPNIEILLYNPDGSENTSVYLMDHAEQRVETTLHVRNPQPGATYRCVVVMSDGVAETLSELERREFDMTLEFRNPDRGEPGFGFGVDWEDFARKHQEKRN